MEIVFTGSSNREDMAISPKPSNAVVLVGDQISPPIQPSQIIEEPDRNEITTGNKDSVWEVKQNSIPRYPNARDVFIRKGSPGTSSRNQIKSAGLDNGDGVPNFLIQLSPEIRRDMEGDRGPRAIK
jgi:hypothetical protein